MKYCFILNPAAGKGEHTEALKQSIDSVCGERGVDYEVYRTACVGDATEYVKRRVAEDPSEQYAFYACGGDGTLCEVVCGAMRLPEDVQVSVGLIPSGTGNDFVRNFSERERFFDIEAQLDAEALPIDLIRCNGLYAINMINVGFDCEVVVKTARLKKKKLIPSKLAYVAGLVITLIRKPGVRMKLVTDGAEREDKPYLLNTYANGCFCGGGFHSNPNAELCDGKIDVLFVHNISRRKFISLVGDYKKGTHLQPKFGEILQNEKVDSVDLYFDDQTNVSVDGEVIQAKELHLSVLQGALRFLIPKGAAFLSAVKRVEVARA
ncbi:MAG: YegS/Rv2252/BmrU family lipid kinase [Clostridia bacterium]|nr:YegS/Rv2252/BmrU family lipid kinase [Clostridia bacterium]